MSYYLGRDYQIDLFTPRCPDDELGRLKSIMELQFFEYGFFFVPRDSKIPTKFNFLFLFIPSLRCV